MGGNLIDYGMAESEGRAGSNSKGAWVAVLDHIYQELCDQAFSKEEKALVQLHIIKDSTNEGKVANLIGNVFGSIAFFACGSGQQQDIPLPADLLDSALLIIDADGPLAARRQLNSVDAKSVPAHGKQAAPLHAASHYRPQALSYS